MSISLVENWKLKLISVVVRSIKLYIVQAMLQVPKHAIKIRFEFVLRSFDLWISRKRIICFDHEFKHFRENRLGSPQAGSNGNEIVRHSLAQNQRFAYFQSLSDYHEKKLLVHSMFIVHKQMILSAEKSNKQNHVSLIRTWLISESMKVRIFRLHATNQFWYRARAQRVVQLKMNIESHIWQHSRVRKALMK